MVNFYVDKKNIFKSSAGKNFYAKKGDIIILNNIKYQIISIKKEFTFEEFSRDENQFVYLESI
jgi:hypothetical protein